VKKSRNSSFEADFATGGGRVKRQRREWKFQIWELADVKICIELTTVVNEDSI
jgi:hypothetical protein